MKTALRTLILAAMILAPKPSLLSVEIDTVIITVEVKGSHCSVK